MRVMDGSLSELVAVVLCGRVSGFSHEIAGLALDPFQAGRGFLIRS
jgi:hypothetical protein